VKSALVLPVLAALGLTMAHVSVVHAEGGITGSVLRVDERTYRIQFDAYWEGVSPDPGCLGDPPTEDAYMWCATWSSFGLRGSFGLPKNSDCCGVMDGQVGCGGIPSRGFSCQFDFEPPLAESSRLTLEWSISGDYFCQWCWEECGGSNLCGSGYAGGVVYADLEIPVGDSTPLQPVVAVESKPWGAVKQLYR
jgi:hypothetical protein